MSTINRILEHHGHRLKRLYCKETFLDLELAAKLLDCCPQLSDLGMQLYRCKGTTLDIDIYRAIGNLPSLKTIHLAIHAFHPSMDPVNLRQTIYLSLKELAIDETLARSIFHTISASKSTYASPLERVQLQVDLREQETHLTPTGGTLELLQYVGRSWTCDRNPGLPHGCFVNEDCNAEEVLEREYFEQVELDKVARGKWAEVIHDVWPASRETSLKDVWHGVPLGESDGR